MKNSLAVNDAKHDIIVLVWVNKQIALNGIGLIQNGSNITNRNKKILLFEQDFLIIYGFGLIKAPNF